MSDSIELPKGWCWTTIAEIIVEALNGFGKRRSEGGTPSVVLRLADIEDGKISLESNRRIRATNEEVEKYALTPNDLIVIRVNGSPDLVGRMVRFSTASEPVLFCDHFIRIRFAEPSLACFAKYFADTDTSRQFVEQNKVSSAGQNTISQATINRLLIPFAPLNEQKRIVAKIEELFSDLDSGVAALQRAKANLKRYRAAVLKAAVEGKLTEEWRAKHPAKEPASALLARILKERRQKWEADQLAKFASAGKEPPKNWRDKYVEPSPPDTSGLSELPESWCWASVQQVGSVQLGRQRAPQHHSGEHMRPYLRVANVFEDRIDTSDVMEMNFTPDEYETYRLSYGDILLNEGQSMELVGRPAIYRDEVPGACFTNTLVRFRVYNGVDTDYALRVFLAYLKNGRFQKIASITVNIAHLGAGRFAEIEFPLPPVEEQAAIIEEVDRHFSLIDAAEEAINLSLARASRLRQSILKQAFEGKLVPQDPKDEPVSVFLERLRASRLIHEGNDNPLTKIRVRRAKRQTKGEE